MLFIAFPEADSVNIDFIQMHRQTFKQFHRWVVSFIDKENVFFFKVIK